MQDRGHIAPLPPLPAHPEDSAMPFVMPFAAPRVRLVHDAVPVHRAVAALLTTAMLLLAAPALAHAQDRAERAPVAATRQPRPNVGYSAQQVVDIQLQALRNNDSPVPDAGIATVFAFASPDNQQATGPLKRFTALVRNPVYAPMLNHRRAELGELDIDGNSASQRVLVVTSTGQHVTYVFTLTRQTTGTCIGCWLTDGVSRTSIDEDGPRLPGTRITLLERPTGERAR